MLAFVASVFAAVSFQQDAPPRPAPDMPEAPAAQVGDVDINWQPETILCVRGEKPTGSRVQASGECRTIAAWRSIQVARAERYRFLLAHSGQYMVDSALEEEGLDRAARIRLQTPSR